MLTCAIINSPSVGSVNILKRKITDREIRDRLEKRRVEAVGLVQGQLAQIIVAADVAEKAADVMVTEISGSCPQHITMIALFGDTSAVRSAMEAIEGHQICQDIPEKT